MLASSARVTLLILWVVVIFVLTGYPAMDAPRTEILHFDKVAHFAMFAIYGMLALRLMKRLAYFLSGLVIVIVAEAQQAFVPGRDVEPLDVLAGALGLVVVFAIAELTRSRRRAIPKT